MGSKEVVSPFSNGSELMDWMENNCCQCDHYWDYRLPWDASKHCEMIKQVWGGDFDHETAKRIGAIDGHGNRPVNLNWKCKAITRTPEFLREDNDGA